jgi:hypothetical protein
MRANFYSLLILYFAFSVQAFADAPADIYCKPRHVGDNAPAYDTIENPYLSSAILVKKDLADGYNVYNKNYPEIKAFMAKECQTNKSANSILYRTSEFCMEKCKANAMSAVRDITFKEKKRDEIAGTCQGVCHKHWWEGSQFLEGYELRMRDSKNDCIKPAPATHESINGQGVR